MKIDEIHILSKHNAHIKSCTTAVKVCKTIHVFYLFLCLFNKLNVENFVPLLTFSICEHKTFMALFLYMNICSVSFLCGNFTCSLSFLVTVSENYKCHSCLKHELFGYYLYLFVCLFVLISSYSMTFFPSLSFRRDCYSLSIFSI
jgi:hypothetical protein